MTQPTEWTFPISVFDLPSGGRSYDISPSPDAHTEIATRLKIPDVKDMAASLTLSPISDGIEISGIVSAELERQCVLSLESVTEHISEGVAITLLKSVSDEMIDSDIILSNSTVDLLEGDTLDLADFVIQQISLAMDPFPKKKDAPSLATEYGKSSIISPFSILKNSL